LISRYIQLHRDTTVYSLTSSPAIIDGMLVYEDSPLVQAVRYGRILVIDEADKAPTHVTAVIKSLVEDGEMVLADGRRLVTEAKGDLRKTDIVIHPQFRIIVLANRPGYPFLGNDFYREIGDVFATHCVENPDPDSELDLLSKYAPSISKELLQKLIAAFNDLRSLVDQGLINYPYSTRELVNVARHLDKYPNDGIARALQNVFAFDVDEDIQNLLVETMSKNGIPTGSQSNFQIELGKITQLAPAVLIESWQKSEIPVPFAGTQSHFNVRGIWPVDITPTWTVISQVNGRAAKFSELLYTFNPFATGEPCDMVLGQGNELYAITTSPVNFYLISPDHRKFKLIPLYEFIPASRVSKLTLVCLGISNVAIYNSQEHSLVKLDLNKREISTILVNGLDPVNDSYLFYNEDFSLVYQSDIGVVILLDLANGEQTLFKTPLKIGSVSKFKDSIIIQELGGSKHAAHFTKDSAGTWYH
jgi:von Willebrand factor A domain-containing protein 8